MTEQSISSTSPESGSTSAAAFVRDMIEQNVLKFGDFTLKSGRRSPYFFNLGDIDDGAGLARLGDAYAQRLIDLDIEFDVIFGPAYKGIPIAVATAVSMARRGLDVGVAFNRKEAKGHGEGGLMVGASIDGKRVLVVDDVMTAGTATIEAASLIDGHGGTLVGVLVALDRQELSGDGASTAVESVSKHLSVPVNSIANLHDVIGYVAQDERFASSRVVMADYQNTYCRN